jgi:release factor glutamine methyltransferase
MGKAAAMIVSRPEVRGVVLPGVFKPLSDTWLLAEAACREAPAARVLELCAGPAFAGIAAARRSGGQLTTVDVSRRAMLNARLNARLNGVKLHARVGDLFNAVRGERFDLILGNPPYVPGPDPPARGAARGWDAGANGRAVLDRICAEAPDYLAPGGTLLLVHSEVCGTHTTLGAYTGQGLLADIAAREHGPLGPLLRARRPQLEAEGLLAPGQTVEEIVVARGRC